MEQVKGVLDTLNDLCASINHFKSTYTSDARFKSPIIDHYNPEYYEQRSIVGLGKFLATAENEREHVQAVYDSGIAPKDFNTNTPNLTAVWHELLRSGWPICSVAQLVECGDEGFVKVDIVGEGGDLWVKVNTMKESRLRAEFREQDSYINSDYDDSDDDFPSNGSTSNNGQRGPNGGAPALTNSVIEQVQYLQRAAKALVRPLFLPPPRIRYVLNRLEEFPEDGHLDPRIPLTFDAVRKLGVELVIGSAPITPMRPRAHPVLAPTRRIMLDLSVVVALCCDSTHHPLPTSSDELEARFRLPILDANGNRVLSDLTPATKDLRDQLCWETAHPVVEEIQDRLGQAGYTEGDVEWYVTQEVKDRTPGIVDLIGGPSEKARVRSLYGDSEDDFWAGSRYEGKEGIMKGIRAKVLERDLEDQFRDMDLGLNLGKFEHGVISVCERMLSVIEGTGTNTPMDGSGELPPAPPPPLTITKQRKTRSRNPKRPHLIFPPPQRLPSVHTLRTLIFGIRNGMTVLTNNRGAVGKVVREMGVQEGLPFDESATWGSDQKGNGQLKRNAVIWVVNPSSLAEWRRLEVDQAKEALEAAVAR